MGRSRDVLGSLDDGVVVSEDSTYGDHDKHALGYVEGMSPVMVGHSAVVLPHSQEPATQDLTDKIPSFRKSFCNAFLKNN